MIHWENLSFVCTVMFIWTCEPDTFLSCMWFRTPRETYASSWPRGWGAGSCFGFRLTHIEKVHDAACPSGWWVCAVFILFMMVSPLVGTFCRTIPTFWKVPCFEKSHGHWASHGFWFFWGKIVWTWGFECTPSSPFWDVVYVVQDA